MRHIDVYINYKYGSKLIPESTVFDMGFIMSKVLEFPITEQKLNAYFKTPPKTKYVVNALYERGIQPKTIAEWLGVNQSTVSYHLNNPLKYPYINQQLRAEIAALDFEEEQRLHPEWTYLNTRK